MRNCVGRVICGSGTVPVEVAEEYQPARSLLQHGCVQPVGQSAASSSHQAPVQTTASRSNPSASQADALVLQRPTRDVQSEAVIREGVTCTFVASQCHASDNGAAPACNTVLLTALIHLCLHFDFQGIRCPPVGVVC